MEPRIGPTIVGFGEREASAAADAVLVAVSAQSLQCLGSVFDEFARVLRPGGHLIVSFSNRMFPQKGTRA